MTEQEIREAAYYNWLNKGCPEGSQLADWVEAEKTFATPVKAKRATKKATVAKCAAKKVCKRVTKKAAK